MKTKMHQMSLRECIMFCLSVPDTEVTFPNSDCNENQQHCQNHCSQHTLPDPPQINYEDQGELQFSQETTFVMAESPMQSPHNKEMLYDVQPFPDLSPMVVGQPPNAVPPNTDWQGSMHFPHSCYHTEPVPADPFQFHCGSSETLQSTTNVPVPSTMSVVHTPPNHRAMPDDQQTPAGVLSGVPMNNTGLPQPLKEAVSDSSTEQRPSQKLLHRLAKNRETARLARRRKREYIKALQHRESELQKLNESLLEEIHAIKDEIIPKSLESICKRLDIC